MLVRDLARYDPTQFEVDPAIAAWLHGTNVVVLPPAQPARPRVVHPPRVHTSPSRDLVWAALNDIPKPLGHVAQRAHLTRDSARRALRRLLAQGRIQAVPINSPWDIKPRLGYRRV